MLSAVSLRSLFAQLPDLPARLPALFDLWRSRKALAALDSTRLADIGISAHEAAAEAQRPLWDVPNGWRR